MTRSSGSGALLGRHVSGHQKKAVLANETGFRHHAKGATYVHLWAPFVSDALCATPSVQPAVAASLSDDVRALLVQLEGKYVHKYDTV